VKQKIARPPIFNQYSLWLLFFLSAIFLSLLASGVFQQETFNRNGLPLFWRFLKASFHPELSLEFLQLTFQSSLITLAYAVCGTFLSIILGIVGGLLASEVWWYSFFRNAKHPIGLGIKAIIAFPRAIHEMIWGLFFVNIWGLDPLVAIGAIALPFGAIVAKVFAEILDETPRQSLDSLLNSGVSPFSAFLYSLIPQAFLNLLSYSFYRFECSLRSAAVLGIIGAGGLGYQIYLSLQSLRYEQLWTLFYALFILNGTVDFLSARLRHYLGCRSRLDLNLRQPYSSSTFKRNQQFIQQKIVAILISVISITLVIFCFWYMNADWSKLWSLRSWELLGQIGKDAFPPALDGLEWRRLLHLSTLTLAMSILAIALAGFFALLFSFPAAQNVFLPGGLLSPSPQKGKPHLLSKILFLFSRAVLLISRAIPAPILALVALFVLYPGILPGAIALAIHNFGILGRLMAEGIENLDDRPLQALKAQGTPAELIFLYGILPLTLTRFLAYLLYRWEVCMRETVIVGLVGAGGLGRLLTEQLSSFDYSGVMVTLGCFILLTWFVDGVSRRVRQSLR